jgi:hypothetical protein
MSKTAADMTPALVDFMPERSQQTATHPSRRLCAHGRTAQRRRHSIAKAQNAFALVRARKPSPPAGHAPETAAPRDADRDSADDKDGRGVRRRRQRARRIFARLEWNVSRGRGADGDATAPATPAADGVGKRAGPPAPRALAAAAVRTLSEGKVVGDPRLGEFSKLLSRVKSVEEVL